MKYIEVRKNATKRVATLAILSALTLAPFATASSPVMAQGGNNSRWNRDVTITGTVVDSGNREGVVRIQQSNGEVVTAYTNNSERFRTGQTVEATGRLRNGNIRNATVRRVGGWGGWGNGGNNNNNTTISGTVIDSGNQVNVVRIQSNGRVYTAQTSQADRFRVGEYVQATGRLRGSTISNATVRRGGWNGGGGNNNQNVTIVGSVIDSQNQTNVVRIQQSGGRVYVAQTGRAERFAVGETVEAKGWLSGSTITNATVRRIGGGSGGAGVITRINFSGNVVDSGNQENVLRVRADNGTTYTVSTTSADRYRINDRVRVTGSYNGSLVTSASISRN